MQKTFIISVLATILGAGIYLATVEIRSQIDQSSGEIVNKTLSNNAKSQLRLIREVQDLIKNDSKAEALEKLKKAEETYMFMLNNACEEKSCS